ncbi:DUF2231 domain-containing protein [Rhodoferax sp.]|uniref:DUF2231 domain-containing protein n=1 Tax=Rhodoferax sp. TaxID=50421 RepID=UPI0008AB0044|nr:DUF2231 domain-containing protein [Rhodoferax sp.]OGB53592.1 MAG: hypothetical protein A2503_05690 [Burkholderiales bacterium RIFOXYD12_FULL_59_19]OGB74475.1 MAG: hypothetical protein A2496_00800 [Burkholderiales bacterium RIFOXYC12_FULL_60_6]OGB86156.1 MAG: hypothetical protein A2535_13795 [Burkholderiales bacterium RIFOXYD2_FULL_59_8]MDO8320794.1 hypothetical protein [Rhodoferax sp.]MDP2680439.1 hypothetical protein [Rhodoferax sp.]
MVPYHHMMAHFPIALLSLTFVLILLRALSSNELVRRLDSTVLIYVLAAGVAGGLGALTTGLMIWPTEATVAGPMARNKILMASWLIVIWSVVLVLRWRLGESVWTGHGRYLMLGLGSIGTVLAAITGTLGGHLLGSPSALSAVLNQFGWNVYQTYFVPHWVLILMFTVGLAGIAIGLVSGRKTAT